ncbi:MAG: hypothetical protein K2Y21_11310 [Phycisphaerales bacterium]|nr:hypothetical protein [Phycisphaerales bacterium]
MADRTNSKGQRGNTSSASGQKQRSPTSTPHTGSRVDPSHAVRQQRLDRSKQSGALSKSSGVKRGRR